MNDPSPGSGDTSPSPGVALRPAQAAEPGAPDAAAGPHPEPVQGHLPHGAIKLIEENCTSCMICARECPSWCIGIDSHTEPIPDLPPGARERTVNVLDRFTIDWSLCMYCGICVEECPFDALEWAAPSLPGRAHADDLVQGIAELRPDDGPRAADGGARGARAVD